MRTDSALLSSLAVLTVAILGSGCFMRVGPVQSVSVLDEPAQSKVVRFGAANSEFDAIEIYAPVDDIFVDRDPSVPGIEIYAEILGSSETQIDDMIKDSGERTRKNFEFGSKRFPVYIGGEYTICVRSKKQDGSPRINGACVDKLILRVNPKATTKVLLNHRPIFPKLGLMSFEELKKGLSEQKFGNDRLKVVRLFAESHYNFNKRRYITVSQVREILGYFHFDDEKVEVCRFFSGSVTDPQNGDSVRNHFWSSPGVQKAIPLISR